MVYSADSYINISHPTCSSEMWPYHSPFKRWPLILLPLNVGWTQWRVCIRGNEAAMISRDSLDWLREGHTVSTIELLLSYASFPHSMFPATGKPKSHEKAFYRCFHWQLQMNIKGESQPRYHIHIWMNKPSDHFSLHLSKSPQYF